MSDTLPALIDRARCRLADARTSAEVLEARAAAKAALHYAKLQKAANETQADCLAMMKRAEIRMADEIDAARRAYERKLAEWRGAFEPSEKRPCQVCHKYQSVAHAHHLFPLSWQAGLGLEKPDHSHVWLCPTHHALVHHVLNGHLPCDIDCLEMQPIARIAARGLVLSGRN
jgi:hypothetical protein